MKRRPALRIGLTGGIGSGKSTVAQALVGHGATLIDTDAISRACTAAGGAAMSAIAEQFGPEYVSADGALERDRMRQLVFADHQARQRLQAIIHPLVQAEAQRQAAAALAAAARCIVFDVPLLVESGRWRAQVDQVLVVDCSEATQIARVMARNGLSRQAVQDIIDSQASRAQRLAAADLVIFNDACTPAELQAEVARLAHKFGL